MPNVKFVVGPVTGVIALAVLILASPFLACFYRSHQFESLVRLQVDSPDCQKTIPGQVTQCCQCYVAFDGVRRGDALEFSGAGLKRTYNGAGRIFQLSGEGEVRSGRNSIELRSGHIYINGEQISGRSTPLRVLVKEDGHLVNQFCDVSW